MEDPMAEPTPDPMEEGWARIEADAKGAFVGRGRFPLRAYSEFMPPPYVGFKPYDGARASASCTAAAHHERALDVTEYEQAQELEPGLNRVASLLVTELARLGRGTSCLLSRTLLENNPAWPPMLAEAAARHGFRHETFRIAMALALSRTQDDKGNVRWTLFGVSHDGPSRPFWASLGDRDDARFDRWLAWMMSREIPRAAVRIIADAPELPAFARAYVLPDGAPLDGVEVIVTFRPFARLPESVQRAYLERRVELVPSPSSLVFFEHKGYAELARELPRAKQIPLLHLFPRVEGGYAVRIPQSGWLDEFEPGHVGYARGHRVVSSVVRTHRWQRVERDQHVGQDNPFADQVSTALFSTDPDDLGLYGKPMAKNAQIWTEDYKLLLDGPRADRAQIAHASRVLHEGGRFGYRFLYPPMRAGRRELFWHVPLVARLTPQARQVAVYRDDALTGYVTAEPAPGETGAGDTGAPIRLQARLLSRPLHVEAATHFPRDPGHARNTASYNVRKVLDFAELIAEGKGAREDAEALAASFARQLVLVPKHATYEDWLKHLAEIAAHPLAVKGLLERLRSLAAGLTDTGEPRTFAQTATRDFEERLWRTIAELAEGEFRFKENADAIAVNRGKTGGAAAKIAHVAAAERSDLERLGEHLHARHRALIARHGLTGKAQIVDHVFQWETDFDFAWSEGWAKNQSGKARERNIVVMIPGKNRREAVIMADHYDTAYMEDVYEADRGGDGLRMAAHGADDNHSATAALLLAADLLLPLSREGKLERDVWLVHLTGEEFPSDCMGARALAQGLVERSLSFTREGGENVDVSGVRVVGAYILDMVAHNNLRDRDTFLICPGEGAASARLALEAHRANMRWNRKVPEYNRAADRAGKGRAQRMPEGRTLPPPFEHLALSGQVAAEWEPRSVLYNTDGQIFSDVGIPVVLFMENYDINRTGYHDTHDTMKNIDLDYAAAVISIAIESVVGVATGESAIR